MPGSVCAQPGPPRGRARTGSARPAWTTGHAGLVDLPAAVRENIRRLGVYVMAETFSLMTKPKPEHLTSIISINRGIAAGLIGEGAGRRQRNGRQAARP